jgi:hypothetical protein
MLRKRGAAIAAAVAAALMVGGIAVPAHAHGTNAWYAIGCGSSYNGQSSYSGASGLGFAVTSKAGGSCTNIGVALRYYAGYGNYTYSVSSSQVTASKSVYTYGGYHSDQNGNVTQHHT